MSFFSKIKKIEQLSPRLRSLYLHRTIRDVGLGLIGIFSAIFFYIMGGSLEFVLILYGFIFVAYLIFAPLWAKLMKFFSLRTLMMVGHFLTVGFFLVLYFWHQGRLTLGMAFALAILFNAAYRLFYWLPYHVDFARFVNKHHRGRQLSFLSIIISLVSIVLPIFSAFIINKFGFSVLFVLSIVVILMATWPMFFIPHTREKYSFGYFETFKKVFSKNHLKTNFAYMADGFQMCIGGFIWPVFIFMVLDGQYLQVGLVSAAVVLVTCVLRYVMGEATDKFDKMKLMKTGSILYSLGWALKALVGSALHIFLVGTFHDFTRVFMRIPFDTLMYEIAADEGRYVDEFTLLREMCLNFGRIFMIIIALILLSFISVVWIFVIAAIASLFINLISKEEFSFPNPNS